jgi:hypothetical protein
MVEPIVREKSQRPLVSSFIFDKTAELINSPKK